MKAKLAKWGNSLALRLPRQFVTELGLSEGSVVELGRDGSRLVAETRAAGAIPRYRLEDLVAEMKRLGPDAEPDTVDWGPDRGAEFIDDDYSRGAITLDDVLKRAGSAKPRKAPRPATKNAAARRRRHRLG
ncbi:MAG: AbrB/MazE/SpoVT family DNA-binding domain-containing protein [Pseudolabrys sp.]|nr:AbrB/MazE/SpoVT family DNA-binding domain-containing protein [Pseudolabrys sp.]